MNLPGKNSEYEKTQIKFVCETPRKLFFTSLAFLGVMLVLIGAPAIPGFAPYLPAAGIFMAVLFAILRAKSDDYLIVDLNKKTVEVWKNFFSSTSSHEICPLKDIKYIKLASESISTKQGKYITYYLEIMLPNNSVYTSEDKEKMVIGNYPFDFRVAALRTYALEIASIAGCKVQYGEDLPERERLRIKKSKKKDKAKKDETIEDGKKKKKEVENKGLKSTENQIQDKLKIKEEKITKKLRSPDKVESKDEKIKKEFLESKEDKIKEKLKDIDSDFMR